MTNPAGKTFPGATLDACATSSRAEALAAQITELCGYIVAAKYPLLGLIREFDENQYWAELGLVSCAHWLQWQCGIGMNAAREKLRAAHALTDLPQISQAFAGSEISYSKARLPAKQGALIVKALDAALERSFTERSEDVTAVTSGIENGLHLCSETSRRIACHATLLPVLDDESGAPLSVGRRSRAIRWQDREAANWATNESPPK